MTSTDALHHLDAAALGRLALLFIHLLGFATAATAVAFGDFAIFSRRRVDAVLLAHAARVVTLALTVLWASGLALTWIDTAFVPAVLAAKAKLLAKFSVVTLLTLNGVALHRFAFPRLAGSMTLRPVEVTVLALLGAVSAATWLYAAFLGVARPLVGVMSYAGFMSLYVLVIGAASVGAVLVVRPRLERRLTLHVEAERIPATARRRDTRAAFRALHIGGVDAGDSRHSAFAEA